MYALYSKDLLPCVYCCKLVNLYYAKSHLKTKQCLKFQNAIETEEKSALLLKFLREINKLKSELRFTD
jgi:hypothetical protein